VEVVLEEIQQLLDRERLPLVVEAVDMELVVVVEQVDIVLQ